MHLEGEESRCVRYRDEQRSTPASLLQERTGFHEISQRNVTNTEVLLLWPGEHQDKVVAGPQEETEGTVVLQARSQPTRSEWYWDGGFFVFLFETFNFYLQIARKNIYFIRPR